MIFCKFRFRKRACLEDRQNAISCKKWHIVKSENAIKTNGFSTILDARHVKRHAAKSGKHYKTNGFQRFSPNKFCKVLQNSCKSNWRPAVVGPAEWQSHTAYGLTSIQHGKDPRRGPPDYYSKRFANTGGPHCKHGECNRRLQAKDTALNTALNTASNTAKVAAVVRSACWWNPNRKTAMFAMMDDN